MTQQMITDRGHMLRAWRADDAPDVLEAFRHPDMASQIQEPLVTVADASGWIDEKLARWSDGTEYAWAITNDDSVLGNVTVSSIDHRHGLGWISYWTMSHHRGSGVASSALRRIATWAFDELDLYRLELGHRVNNPASCRVATAAGFLVEGVEREKLRYDGERFDVELHARLATDPTPIPTAG